MGGGVRPDYELLDEILERSRRPFADAAWGIGGALLGVAAVVLVFLLLGIGFAVAAALLDLDREAVMGSVAIRYGLAIASQFVLFGIAFLGARLFGAGGRALGFREATLLATLEGVLGGIAAFVASLAYERFLAIAWPQGHRALMEEVAEQMTGLEGPLPLLLFAAVVLAPLGEEIFFRGYVYGGLRSGLAARFAIPISAVIFGAAHLMPWSIVPLALVGSAAAFAYERRRSIAAPIALHATFNLVSIAFGLLFPQP